MSWRGTQGGIAAAREHHHVVMTPGQYLYFDKRGTDSPDEPVSLNLSLPLEKIYGYDPAEGLSEEEQQYLLGVQANLWTEFVATGKRVEYQLLPRIYALSEIAWSPVARKSWEEFSRQRLPAYLARLDAEGAAYQVPQPHGIREETLEGGCFRFTIRPPFPGCRVYYTLNGATPYDFDREVPGELEVIVPRGGGTTGAQMRRRHPRRTPEHGRHHPHGQPRRVTRRIEGQCARFPPAFPAPPEKRASGTPPRRRE